MKKKILSAFLAIFMIFALPAAAFAEHIRVFDETHAENSCDIAFRALYNEATGVYLTRSFIFQQQVLADPAKTAKEFGFEALRPNFRENRTLEEQLDLYDEILNKMREFDYEKLSLKNKFDYDFLEEFLETELMQRNVSDLFYTSFDIHTDYSCFIDVFDYGESGTEEDLIFSLGLFNGFYDDVKAACEHELLRLENGLMLSALDLDYLIDFLTYCIDKFRGDPAWQTIVGDYGTGLIAKKLSDEKIKKYDAEYKEMIADEILPACELMVKTFTTIRDSGREYRGLAAIEGGAEYYKYLVRNATGIVFDDFGALYDELDAIYRQKDRDIEDFENDEEKMALLDEPYKYDFENMTAEEIFGLWIEIADKHYDPPLTTECEIVHAPIERASTRASYSLGLFGEHINKISIGDGDFNESVAEAASTIAHEGIPGHMYHENFLAAQNDPLKSVADLNGVYRAFTEGWAYHTEFSLYNADDIGANEAQAYYYKNAMKKSMLFYAKFALRLHEKGFSQEELLADQEVTKTPDYYEDMFRDVMSIPADMLREYIGWEAFDNARVRAENTLGEYFDEKEYHAFLTDLGMCGLSTLEKWEGIWLEKTLAARKAENADKNPDTGVELTFAVFAAAISSAGIAVLRKTKRAG